MEATLIDKMGSDPLVVDAARVSFSKISENYTEEQNNKLIRYLAKHNHWTPFGHPQISIREKVPIFVARQRMKHQIGFVYNETSRRYVDDPPEFYRPERWRHRPDGSIKQGSGLDVNDFVNDSVNKYYDAFIKQASNLYAAMISDKQFANISPEMARMILPQSMYTEYVVTGSLAAWARAYKLRIDLHSQEEIRTLAVEWDKIIRPLFPVSWEALVG